MRRCAWLILVSSVVWANPNGISGYSGKAGVTCSQCHTNQAAMSVTASLAGPSVLEPGRRTLYTLRLTGRTTGKAGANIASVAGVVLDPASTQLDERPGAELVHRSPSSFTDPSFVDGGVTFPFYVTALVDAGTTVTVYAAAQWVGGTGTAAPARVHAITFPINVVAPNLAPVVSVAAAGTVLDGGTSATVSVTATDDEPEALLTYTWSSGDAGVSFAPNGTNAAKAAMATFPRAGAFTLNVRVTDADGASSVSSAAVAVSQQFRSVRLTPPSATVQFGSTQAFGASARDQFGQSLPNQPTFAWAVSDAGIITDAGVFIAGPRAATGIVSATGSGVIGRATITVASGSPPTLSGTTATVRGRTVALSTVGTDDTGEPALLYTWTATGPAAVTFASNGTNAAKVSTATLTQAGSYVFTVEVRDVSGFTANTSVTRQVAAQLTSLAVTPARVTLMPSTSQQFTLAQRDQFARPMPTLAAVVWSAFGSGSVSTTGLYAAGSTLGGPFQVRATVGSLTQAADVTISSGGAPVFTREVLAQPSTVFGKTSQLRAVADDAAGESALTFAWTAEGPADVVFSANRTNAASRTQATFGAAGVYSVTVTATNGAGRSTTSSTEVTVEPSADLIEVTPRRVWVAPGQSQVFSARSLDQFGDAMATVEPDWRALRGGTVDTAGLFIAEGLEGTFELTAALDGRFGSASVLVDGTAPRPSLKGVTPRTTVKGEVRLEASVVEAGALASVSFLVDGTSVGQVTSPPYEFTWPSTSMPDGRVTLEVRAVDAAGNVGTSEPLEVAVWNDGSRPSPYAQGCNAAGASLSLFTLLAWALQRRAALRSGGRS